MNWNVVSLSNWRIVSCLMAHITESLPPLSNVLRHIALRMNSTSSLDMPDSSHLLTFRIRTCSFSAGVDLQNCSIDSKVDHQSYLVFWGDMGYARREYAGHSSNLLLSELWLVNPRKGL